MIRSTGTSTGRAVPTGRATGRTRRSRSVPAAGCGRTPRTARPSSAAARATRRPRRPTVRGAGRPRRTRAARARPRTGASPSPARSASGAATATSAGSTSVSEMNERSATTSSGAGVTSPRAQRPDVDALADLDPRVLAQRVDELVVPDVDGHDPGGAAAQQHVGEPAGARARVEAAAARRRPGRPRRARRARPPACARRARRTRGRRRRPGPATCRSSVTCSGAARHGRAVDASPGRPRSARRRADATGPGRDAPAPCRGVWSPRGQPSASASRSCRAPWTASNTATWSRSGWSSRPASADSAWSTASSDVDRGVSVSLTAPPPDVVVCPHGPRKSHRRTRWAPGATGRAHATWRSPQQPVATHRAVARVSRGRGPSPAPGPTSGRARRPRRPQPTPPRTRHAPRRPRPRRDAAVPRPSSSRPSTHAGRRTAHGPPALGALLRLRVRDQQRAQVGADQVRALPRHGEHVVTRRAHTRQHVQADVAARPRTGQVGVQTVADDERSRAPRPARRPCGTSSATACPRCPARTPVAARTAPTSEPLPGANPRAVGRLRSRFDATCHAPRPTAYAASASCGQPTSGAKPCATAAGSSSAELHDLVPGLPHGRDQPRAADDQHLRPARQPRRQQLRRRLRGRHDLRRLRARCPAR